eukprot:TRINITY_DN28764_c0_g1_i2.p1 TRINITY_DN28764_c0_g1~~TRINITY_DN28764_c0_g1_i2.p1  ORF type:complete len:181 (-),score=23.41 TRINITY_DN28764_c0_g1_i2:44-586(-)
MSGSLQSTRRDTTTSGKEGTPDAFEFPVFSNEPSPQRSGVTSRSPSPSTSVTIGERLSHLRRSYSSVAGGDLQSANEPPQHILPKSRRQSIATPQQGTLVGDREEGGDEQGESSTTAVVPALINSQSTTLGEYLPVTAMKPKVVSIPVSYTHLRAHETPEHLVCRLLLEKKKTNNIIKQT